MDGETLFYMNDMNLLKPFKLSYKYQIIFLKEREKLFLLKTNEEKSTLASISDNSPLLIVDETDNESLEIETDLIQASEDFSNSTMTISTKSLEEKKLLPDPYLLPVLQVK